MPELLPTLLENQARETAAIYATSHLGFKPSWWGQRPFRAPHHTSTSAALIGGGAKPKPGEISLAHHGVLFLDELPEFDRRTLEALREPMEAGVITVSRAVHTAHFPAQFLLVAAMNPCPCGYLGDPIHNCQCTQDQIQKYRAKISGPLLDRIDMHVFVPRLPLDELIKPSLTQVDETQTLQALINDTRQRQMQHRGCYNATLSTAQIETYCHVPANLRQFLAQTLTKLGASSRSYYRILKLARTIADLQKQDRIDQNHLLEALQLRQLDRPAKPKALKGIH